MRAGKAATSIPNWPAYRDFTLKLQWGGMGHLGKKTRRIVYLTYEISRGYKKCLISLTGLIFLTGRGRAREG